MNEQFSGNLEKCVNAMLIHIENDLRSAESEYKKLRFWKVFKRERIQSKIDSLQFKKFTVELARAVILAVF